MAVNPREGHRLWVCFDDGIAGEVDVSFLQNPGRWKTWDDREFYEEVRIDPVTHCVSWWENWVDLHPRWLYAELTGSGPVEDDLVPHIPTLLLLADAGSELDDADDSVPAVELPAVVAAEPRDGLKIWVSFDDGETGEVDLSHFRQKGGMFRAWDDRWFFESVRVDPESGFVAWGDGFIDLCPDSLYALAIGKAATAPSAAVRS